MTIYLFGIIQQRFTMRNSYDYIQQHWADRSSGPVNHSSNFLSGVSKQINQIGWHFWLIVDSLTVALPDWPILANVRLSGSLPIIRSKRPYPARVASQIADKGYVPTKQLYYHGFRPHLVGIDRLRATPLLLPERTQFSRTSTRDLTALRQYAAYLPSAGLHVLIFF